jgi:hypothetical protein
VPVIVDAGEHVASNRVAEGFGRYGNRCWGMLLGIALVIRMKGAARASFRCSGSMYHLSVAYVVGCWA